ncbi:hypothetical protein, partial [Streptomyces sp. NPDC048425]|uniref:hypothetical protein n=1 Tax=Streptomyces sp. NPDC048425 TaxID=3365548 RepID=UPI00371AF6A6
EVEAAGHRGARLAGEFVMTDVTGGAIVRTGGFATRLSERPSPLQDARPQVIGQSPDDQSLSTEHRLFIWELRDRRSEAGKGSSSDRLRVTSEIPK